MNTMRIPRIGVLVLATGALAASVPITADGRGVRPTEAECQDGTCCPEAGSKCVVGDIVRPDKYYKSSGSCTDPSQPAPPP
jgi:hypothetical protein